MAILELHNMTKRFGGLTAVDGLNLSVERDQIYGIIGPNGAGKTTAFNCITGIHPPEEGEVLWQGAGDAKPRNITGLPPYKVASLGIVRTFQTIRLFSEMSVAENVMSGRHFRGKQHWWHGICHTPSSRKDETANWEKVKETLDFFNILQFAKEPVGSLAYGFQRKVEMARALVSEPELLILDEPAAGLNDSETLELVETIYSIRKMGVTILLIEHNMDLVMTLTDYITVINFGKQISEGLPDRIQSDPLVIEAYLGSEDDNDEQ
ncbi:MAG: ABC transporter ATP-binding protein [Desulfobacteraceae bacterium]